MKSKRARADVRVERAGAELADLRLDLGDPLRREDPAQERTVHVVRGRILEQDVARRHLHPALDDLERPSPCPRCRCASRPSTARRRRSGSARRSRTSRCSRAVPRRGAASRSGTDRCRCPSRTGRSRRRCSCRSRVPPGVGTSILVQCSASTTRWRSRTTTSSACSTRTPRSSASPSCPPQVSRGYLEVAPGQRLSYIRWGADDTDPELVFLHGGGQNAHTWDYVTLALGRPPDRDRPPRPRAFVPARRSELRPVEERRGARPRCRCSRRTRPRSSACRSAARPPRTWRRSDRTCAGAAVVVDVTPQVNDPTRELTTQERGSVALIGGPPTYQSFEEMAEAAIALSPYRAASGCAAGASQLVPTARRHVDVALRPVRRALGGGGEDRGRRGRGRGRALGRLHEHVGRGRHHQRAADVRPRRVVAVRHRRGRGRVPTTAAVGSVRGRRRRRPRGAERPADAARRSHPGLRVRHRVAAPAG